VPRDRGEKCRITTETALRDADMRRRPEADMFFAMGIVAIYEPNDLMRALLREWLTAAGYTVRDSLMDSDLTMPDLAIVSVETPKTESGVLIRGLQHSYPGTPIIALSSRARSGLCSNGAAAQALGVARLLAKPLRRHELLMAVDEAIGPRESA
jgi:DNA-binding response OmpR family regulator